MEYFGTANPRTVGTILVWVAIYIGVLFAAHTGLNFIKLTLATPGNQPASQTPNILSEAGESASRSGDLKRLSQNRPWQRCVHVMGCSGSMVQPRENGFAPGTPTQSKEFPAHLKRLVLRNWKYLANDLTGRGSRIFLRIFLMHPHIKALFPCRHLEGEELTRDPHFKGHASRFMQAVGAVVDNIDNYERALSPLLKGLGRKHIHFAGFKPDYFDAFEEAIMYIWAEDLGPKFDEDTRQAWHQVFQFLMGELKQGFHDALDEDRLSIHSEIDLASTHGGQTQKHHR